MLGSYKKFTQADSFHWFTKKKIKIPFKSVSQCQCWQSLWGFSLFQQTFYDRPRHFLSHSPEVNKLHMFQRARLLVQQVSSLSARLCSVTSSARSYRVCLHLTQQKNVSEEATGQILHTHLILLQAWQQWDLSETDFGCSVTE